MTVLLVLVFMGVFSLILSAVMGYVLQQAKYGRMVYARESALHVAEAGLEYYRWYLAHNPSVLVNGAGLVTSAEYEVTDPEGGAIGTASISAAPHLQCGAVQWIDIESEGVPDADSNAARTISARYMRPSVAGYSYIVNTSVWAGADRTIRGPYHSNGGIRMDATHNSDVTSKMSNWDCTSSYGCSPSQGNAPGVVGSGSNPALWRYPVPDIMLPFSSAGLDLSALKTRAQTGGGIYRAAASGLVDERGYHLVFQADGKVRIYRVSDTNGHWSKSSQYGHHMEYSRIQSELLLGTYNIPSSCALLFFEDRVWIEGAVKGKVTVVAATPSDSLTAPDVYLSGNILYSSYDGSDGLAVIAEDSVLIPLVVPNQMEIHGIFIASVGHYGRDEYTKSGAYQVPSSLDQYVKRARLTTVGTVVSSGRTGTSWVDSNGNFMSGFEVRNDYYDQTVASSPPPFAPISSTDYRFELWRER